MQKKLLRKALYTSPLMAVPSISPFFLSHEISFRFFQIAMPVQTLVVFLIWSINIGLISFYFSGLSERKASVIRYFFSYLLALLVILIVRESMIIWVNSDYFTFSTDKIPSGFQDGVPYLMRPIPYYGVILSFSINTVILIIQDVIMIKEKKAQADLENSRLKLKNAEIVNQELKEQLHPHFLFNALNTLKNLIRKEPNLAEDYLIRLSNFLRVSISSSKANAVKLGEELSMCIDYLEMQRTRFGSTLQYAMDIPEYIKESGFVPIFSIQLLLENAIKHNAMYKNAPLWINLDYDIEEHRVKVTNNRQKRETQEYSTGLGLENLAERYRLLSGDKVNISANEESFSVSIKILKDEDCNYRR